MITLRRTDASGTRRNAPERSIPVKKTLILVLSLAAVLVLCVSCAAKKAEEKMVDYRIFNSTGEKVVEITLRDSGGSQKVSVTPAETDGWEEGAVSGFSVNVAEFDRVLLSWKTESGYTFESSLPLKDTDVTLLPREDGGIALSDLVNP